MANEKFLRDFYKKWARLEIWEIPTFETWAVKNGWTKEDPKGAEVLRLRKGDKLAVLYRRTKRARLATLSHDAVRLVAKFNWERRPPSALEIWSDEYRKKKKTSS